MAEIGGVWFGDHAFEHMRQIAEQTVLVEGDNDPELINEARVIHVFHEEFPGVVMREADEEV